MEENNVIKISQMPTAGALPDTAKIPVVSGGQNLSAAVGQLRDALAPADWHGTQPEYNALDTYDDKRFYVITDSIDGHTVAVYRGARLLTAEPNVVGEFSADSLPEDWYWWPENVKTPLPVDPATKRFSFYYPGVLSFGMRLFAGGKDAAKDKDWCRIVKLEKVPFVKGSHYYMLGLMPRCERFPVIDCRYVHEYIQYLMLESYKGGSEVYLKNTEKVYEWVMTINNVGVKKVDGMDLTSTIRFLYQPLSAVAYAGITNLGKARALTAVDFKSGNWGDDTIMRGARQSLVDALLTTSFDRAAAGYPAVTVTLSPEAFARLTADEVAAITAKGYTIVTQ